MDVSSSLIRLTYSVKIYGKGIHNYYYFYDGLVYVQKLRMEYAA